MEAHPVTVSLLILGAGILALEFGLKAGLIDTETYNAVMGVVVILSILSEFLVRQELKKMSVAADSKVFEG